MTKEEAYLDIAKRYIESCEEHINNNIGIQEVIGFKSYHAFESIAGAYNSHYGRNIPRSHVSKLNLFVVQARNDNQIDGRIIAQLTMLLHSARNKYLYPEHTGSEYEVPQDQISITDATRLFRRVRGIIRRVENLM